MKKHIQHILLYSLFLAGFSGCFVYDPAEEFVKQRYINTVAYFNTFYNAQRSFSEAEDEVLLAQKDFQEKQTPNKQFVISQTARAKFTSSIEKNSKILTFYPNSKWVDDALLMIGKAYSYMGDDVKAERKFVELFAKYPESDLIAEGQLWYGKSLVRQKKNMQGIAQLEQLIAGAGTVDEDISGAAAYELGEYYFRGKDFSKALTNYRQALRFLSGNEDIARINFKIGICFEGLEQYPEAAEAFSVSGNKAPGYSLVFQSEFRKIKAIASQGLYDQALDEFNAMLSDAKNLEYFSSIQLAIANTIYLKGDIQSAIQKYRYIDTVFVRTEESAQSYYKLGKIYENEFVNYDSARVYYNKAKGEFPASEITPDAALKANIFNRYSQIYTALGKYDSLYRRDILDLPAVDSMLSAAKDSLTEKLAAAASKNTRTLKSQKKDDSSKDSVVVIDSTNYKNAVIKLTAQKVLIDSMFKSIIRNKFELASLFFIDLQRSDSALFWYNSIIREYPQSEFAPRSLYTVAEINRGSKNAGEKNLDSIYSLIVAHYPESPYAQEARKNLGISLIEKTVDPAQGLFDSAEVLIENKNIPKAMGVLFDIPSHHAASPVVPQALYAAGWCYENELFNIDSAVSVYRRLLIQFPLSVYAAAVRGKVIEFDNEMKKIEMEALKKKEDEEKQKEVELKAKENPPAEIPAQKADSLAVPQKL